MCKLKKSTCKHLATRFGLMQATYLNHKLIGLTFIETLESTHLNLDDSPLTQWLAQYEKNQPGPYEGTIHLNGTPFQLRVWTALQAIPYGETRSYTDIALAIGQPRAVRAVAQACKQNPIALIVPCHRVIAKDGQLGGYAGRQNHPLKRLLLQHEQRTPQ